jgi:hypothetical protein
METRQAGTVTGSTVDSGIGVGDEGTVDDALSTPPNVTINTRAR